MRESPDFIADTFRRHGHRQADLDPLGQLPKARTPEIEDLRGPEAEFFREIYCRHVGAEFMHLEDSMRRTWIAQHLETPTPPADARHLLKRILRAETFEKFLHTRYVGAKRFSLEGLAALIPLLDSILDEAARLGFETIMIGMPHRGRLNVMWNIVNLPAQAIFAAFEDVDPRSAFGRGDVKYHRGATGVYSTPTGKSLRVRLASNPSHLEATNPVVLGRVRARQDRSGDVQRRRILAVLIHGDAAFAGQGITAETLNFEDMPGYSVGGAIHIIANNLIGFTTMPASCYSTRYATDLAKRIPAPIFHVHGERPSDVVRIGKIAMQYRSDFSSSVYIDLLGFRRYGHNEGDDPTITSPALYRRIQAHPPLSRSYAESLGVSVSEVDALEHEIVQHLAKEREEARAFEKQPTFFSLPSYWEPYVGGAYDRSYETPTAVAAEELQRIAASITELPGGFHAHPKIEKLFAQRREMASGSRPVDWGMAEALAFGTLLAEGKPVRLSGQDSRRGTFSHRHAVLFDYETEEEYCPLARLATPKTRFEVYDSALSEASVLGFEYGFSRDFPERLVCWEAQFGDFANGAQVIIDQFITAGEDKWGLLSGLVLLLPHGYEGMGPEHSSARLERFLQLCADDNIQVVQPSTAAQYFHLLRRQAGRRWRKPLIVMTPKSMLRLPAACSPIGELSNGRFCVIGADEPQYQNAEKLLLCSGKIVHELRSERAKRAAHQTAILSLEQLYPFPDLELAAILEQYSELKHIVWVQEEPANMGALTFVRPYLEQLTDRSKIAAVRRSENASPATGSAKAHEIEQQALINLAFAERRTTSEESTS